MIDLLKQVAGDLYEVVEIKDAGQGIPEYRARLRTEGQDIIAWTELEGHGYAIFWKDTKNRSWRWPYKTSLTSKSIVQAVRKAANRALRTGGWAAKLAELTVLFPPDYAMIRPENSDEGEWVKWDVIPIGAATNLVKVDALAKVFLCGREKVKSWLKMLRVPYMKLPNNRNYFSLAVLEMAILIHIGVAKDWSQAADILTVTQSIYKAAKRDRALTRLREIAQTLKPSSKMLRKTDYQKAVARVDNNKPDRSSEPSTPDSQQ